MGKGNKVPMDIRSFLKIFADLLSNKGIVDGNKPPITKDEPKRFPFKRDMVNVCCIDSWRIVLRTILQESVKRIKNLTIDPTYHKPSNVEPTDKGKTPRNSLDFFVKPDSYI